MSAVARQVCLALRAGISFCSLSAQLRAFRFLHGEEQAILLFAARHVMQRYRQSVLVLDTLPAMQRHADYARRGYVYASVGVVRTDKVVSLARKFDCIYGTSSSRRLKQRARDSGMANSVLIFYRRPQISVRDVDAAHASGDYTVGFTLMITDGDHPARHTERLLLLTDEHTRLRIGNWELVRRTRPGQQAAAWTWAMQRTAYQEWRERLLRSARGDMTDSPEALLVELYGSPGFAATRSQVGHLVAWYRRCWRRYRGRGRPFPRLPRLYYVQRLPNTGYLVGRN